MRSMGLILLIIMVDLRAQAAGKPDGEMIYTKNCAVCHTDSKVGAPRLGDVSVWKPRLQQGLDKMLTHVSRGSHAKCKACSNSEVKEAVKYMANQSVKQGNFTLW